MGRWSGKRLLRGHSTSPLGLARPDAGYLLHRGGGDAAEPGAQPQTLLLFLLLRYADPFQDPPVCDAREYPRLPASTPCRPPCDACEYPPIPEPPQPHPSRNVCEYLRDPCTYLPLTGLARAQIPVASQQADLATWCPQLAEGR